MLEPQVLSAAGVGGLLYWMMIFPVDVVKSAIMTDSIVPAERKYTGMISTAQVWDQRPFPAPALQVSRCSLW